MKDEEYLFQTDCREKKNVANSARYRRGHTGRGGKVRFPSDSLTKKEKEAMNGECKSYKLNEPMKWAEFKAMPLDIQELYLRLLRTTYSVPWTEIESMFGVARCVVTRHMKSRGIEIGGKLMWNSSQKEKWFAFLNGVPHSPVETQAEEIPVKETTVEIVEEIPDLEEVAPETVTIPETNWFLEIEKLHKENLALKDDYSELKCDYAQLEIELEKARAQLDIVHLIFGGK